MPRSPAEIAFLRAWQLLGLEGSDMEEEYRFHPTRKHRFDFAFPSQKLAVEIDGRGRRGHEGRHHSFTGASKDAEKLNAAAKLGWRVMRFQAHDKARCAQWARDVVEALCYTGREE